MIGDGLATDVSSASLHKMNESFDRLSVKISLTAKGEGVLMKVIKMVYMYINMFKAAEPDKTVYEQL